MGVIHLNGPMLGKLLQGDLPLFKGSQHVLKGAAHKEVLLLEAQATTLVGPVIGIEHLGEGFRPHLFLDGAVVVADVEGIEVKALGGVSAPEAKAVAGVHLIPQNRHVVGDADGVLCRHPAGTVVTLVVGIAFGMAAKAHHAGFIRLGQLPRPSGLQPLVRNFHLPTVTDQLVEDAKLVADAVAHGRHLQTGQGLHVAGGQTPQATVAQSRLFLHLQHRVRTLDPKLLQGQSRGVFNPQHHQVVAQLRTDEELC